MLLFCKVCSQSFHSLLIPQDKAYREVVDKIAKHISHNHPSSMQAYVAELQGLARALDSCLTVQRLISIPPNETFALSLHDGAEAMLLDALGIDENELEGEAKGQITGDSSQEPSPDTALGKNTA